MSKNFTVQGVNPATGGIAVLTLLAPSATDAKQQAEGAGLLYVVVREAPDPAGDTRRGRTSENRSPTDHL